VRDTGLLRGSIDEGREEEGALCTCGSATVARRKKSYPRMPQMSPVCLDGLTMGATGSSISTGSRITIGPTCSVRARRNWLRVLPPIPVTNISPYASSFSRCATLGSITSPLAPVSTRKCPTSSPLMRTGTTTWPEGVTQP